MQLAEAVDHRFVCLLYTSDAADDLLCVDLGHALEQRAQVQLAEAVDHRFVGRAHMFDLQARVFVDELLQDFPHALLVAAPLGLDGEAVHRYRKVKRLQVQMVVFGGIVQHLSLIHI